MIKFILAAIVWVVGTMFSSALVNALHLPFPTLPQDASQAERFALFVLGSVLLAAGMTPLASRLRGGFVGRWGALAALLFICIGVNTSIEAVVFSSTMTPAQGITLALMTLIPSVLGAAVLARRPKDLVALPAFGGPGWAWRLFAAWLAFPVIYYFFGSIIAPFVTDAYLQGISGLRIPTATVVITTQLVRSPIFLGAILPCVLLWNGSRRSLGFHLGLALAIAIGIYGLVQATFFPMHLRIIHSLEITADEFTYAFVLAWLFRPAPSKEASGIALDAHPTLV